MPAGLQIAGDADNVFQGGSVEFSGVGATAGVSGLIEAAPFASLNKLLVNIVSGPTTILPWAAANNAIGSQITVLLLATFEIL